MQYGFSVGWFHVAQWFGVCTVDFKFLRFDDMTKLSKSITEELSFINLEGNSDISKDSKNLVDVLDVFLNRSLEHDDVVDIHEKSFTI